MITTTTYAESLARRILAGAGGLSLVPYQLDPNSHVPVLAHGLDAYGRFVVATTAEDAGYMGDTRVRVDGIKKALEFDVDITVASLHALGSISWLAADDFVPGFDYEPSSPLRFGVIELDTVYIHGPHGTTKLDFEELLPGIDTEGLSDLNGLEAREQVDRLSPSQLGELMDGVVFGVQPGFILADREQPVCDTHRQRVWIADIDTHGVVLLHAGDNRTTAALVSFPAPVGSTSDLAAALDALAAHTSVR